MIIFHISPAQNLLEKEISLNLKNQTIDSVLRSIENLSGLPFSYSNNILNNQEIVSIKVRNSSIKETLEKMFKDKRLQFLVVENHIVIKRENSNKNNNNRFTISGYVLDNLSGEVLIGANIVIPELNTGTISNEYGFYSITLPEGEYQINYSFLGYMNIIKTINLQRDIVVSEKMNFNRQFLGVVVVNAREKEDVVKAQKINMVNISPTDLQETPGFMGEKDIIKSLQLIPGVKNHGDGSSFFYVRGGDRDQNLILIDEAPVYNPSHLLGFYTSFIPEATKDIKLYKGNQPVKYGGRLSSVLHIRTKDGNDQRLSGSGSLGLFTHRFTLEGPLKKDKISLFTSIRRSNLNWLINQGSTNTDIRFSDFNFKINWRLNSRNRLFFSSYSGVDKMIIGAPEEDKFGIKWNNFAFTLRWNHLFSDRFFSNTTLTGSNYDYYLIISEANNEFWNSNISSLSFKNDFTFFHTPKTKQTFGFAFGGYTFNPGELVLQVDQGAFGYSEYFMKLASEVGLYHGFEHEFSKKLSVDMGYRLSFWNNIGPATEYGYNQVYQVTDTTIYADNNAYNGFEGFEPRVGMTYKIDSLSGISINYSKTKQYLQVLSNSISPFTSLEIWLPSGPNILPQKAKQYSIEYFKRIQNHNLDLTAEVFYKDMFNQIDYTDHARMLLNPLIEAELRFGTSWAYGLELLVKKQYDKIRGWIGYSYSRTRKKIKDLNNGEPFAPFYDRPHAINLNLSYYYSKRWLFSANWIYSSGSAISQPIGYFQYQGYTLPVYGAKNNARLPDYHRLDVSATLDLNSNSEKRFQHDITFSLYNAYWRKNYFSINYNKTFLDNGSIVIPSDMYKASDLVPTGKYIFGILPSITYNLRF